MMIDFIKASVKNGNGNIRTALAGCVVVAFYGAFIPFLFIESL